jgi:hypothetical protein
MMAKAYYETRSSLSEKYRIEMDAEGVRLGLGTPEDAFLILPDGHPMWAKAQQLLDAENEAKALMYQAAFNLFDWATESTLARLGTSEQKTAIRDMVVKVKAMAFVEKPFEDLVSASMGLVAA